jgi:hypothetical protein
MTSLQEEARLANTIELRTNRSVPKCLMLAAIARADKALKYSLARHLFYCHHLNEDDRYGVFGDGDNGAYEWFIWRAGELTHSDKGYGQTDIALRDVLLKLFPLHEIREAAPLFLAVVLTGLLFLGIPLPAKAEQPSFCLTQFAGAQERSRLGQDENPEIVAASNGAGLLPHDSSAPEIAITAFRPGRKSGFLTKRNVALLTASAATLSLDALSTQRNFGQGLSEINPVLRHLQSRGGTSLYFAGSLAAETGAMYFAHKRGWKRTQWLIPSAVVAVETYWVAKNFSLQPLPAAPPKILKAVAEFHF